MSNEFNDSELHLLAGAYALDAVDDVERARFERHLQTCPQCQLEVDEMRATAAKLGEAETLPAPPQLRDAVLSQIATTPQAFPLTHMTSAERSSSRWTTRLLGVAAAVLAIGLATVSTVAYQQHQQNESITANAQLVTDVLTAPDAQVRHMPMGGASSTVVMSPSLGQAALVAQGVPSLPSNQTYELWTVTAAGTARPAGTWVPSPDGTVAVPISGNLSDTAAIAVTVEPAGGSAQPTTAPIATVKMA